MTAWLVALTDFGDIAVLIPLAVVTLLWLLLLGSYRTAAWWAAAVGFCVGLTTISKIYFYGCPPAADMHSPSGHTSVSTLVYGAMALVTAVEGGGLRRLLAIGAGASFVLAIAASRLLLDAHSVPEVGLGLLIGTISLALFGRKYLRSPQAKVWPLLVAATVLLSILHGYELHAEEFIQRITGYLHVSCT